MRRRLLWLVVGVLLLTAFGVLGVRGSGEATLVGTHRFVGTMACQDCGLTVYDVFEPPAISPFLLTGRADPHVVQVSPDGSWLYVLHDGYPNIAAASASWLAFGDMEISIWSRLAYGGTEGGYAATRIHLDPPIDAAQPPGFFSAGVAVPVESYQP